MQDSHLHDEHSAIDNEVTSDIEPSASSVSEQNATPPPPWSSEPFRAFFPLGIAAAITGSMIWPLFYARWWLTYPNQQHPLLMIYGFGAAFVAGFLGTAWPRFVEARPMSSWELGLLILTWFGAQVAWLFSHFLLGNLLIGLHLLGLFCFLLHRAAIGKDRPPFSLGIAFTGPLVGCIAISLLSFGTGTTLMLARLLAWQGMLLLPLLGVGAMLFPRFFPAAENATESKRLDLRLLWFFAFLLVVSFFVEAAGWVRSGSGLRFAAVTGWLLTACPEVVRGPAPSTRAWVLRVGLASIALSFLIRTFWPGPFYAVEHLMFLAGFGLTITLIAERVTLGHADCAPKPNEKSLRWRWFAWLLLIAASTRMSADMKLSLLKSHHIYAALMWIGVLIAWAWPLLRHWRSQPTP